MGSAPRSSSPPGSTLSSRPSWPPGGSTCSRSTRCSSPSARRGSQRGGVGGAVCEGLACTHKLMRAACLMAACWAAGGAVARAACVVVSRASSAATTTAHHLTLALAALRLAAHPSLSSAGRTGSPSLTSPCTRFFGLLPTASPVRIECAFGVGGCLPACVRCGRSMQRSPQTCKPRLPCAGKKCNPHLVRDSIVTYLRGGGATERELEALAIYMASGWGGWVGWWNLQL